MRRQVTCAVKPKAARTAALLLALWPQGLFAAEPPPAAAATAVPKTDGSGLGVEDLSLVNLLEVEVVSASDAGEKISQAPAVIDVITREELTRFGYRTLVDALEMVAGLQIAQDHAKEGLGIRGVASGPRGWSSLVKVMIDGHSVAFRPTGENFLDLSLIPLSVVERVEIIRGPASVLYGANAFLGVINIITRRGHTIVGGEVSGGGVFGAHESNPWGQVAIGGDNGRVELVLGAAAETLKREGYGVVPLPGLPPISDESSEGADRLNGSLFGRVSWLPDSHQRVSLDGNLQLLDRDAEFMDWGPLTHGNRFQLFNGYLRLQYQGEAHGKVFWNVSLARIQGGVGPEDHLQSRAATGRIERQMGATSYDCEVSTRYHFSQASQFSLGVDSSIDNQTLMANYTVAPDGTRTLNPPASTQTGNRLFLRLGAYANTTIYPFEAQVTRPWARLGVTAGARIDSQNIFGENVSGRGGLVYSLPDNTYFKLLYGSSYRAPAPSQLFSNYVEARGAIGNPELRPEVAHTGEVAMGVMLMRGMTLRVDAFASQIIDRVEIRRPPPPARVTNKRPVNSTPISSFGGELELDYRTEQLHLFASYSAQISHYLVSNFLSVDERQSLLEAAGYPNHLVKVGASYDLPSFYSRLMVQGRLVGSQAGNQENNLLVNGASGFTEQYRLAPYFLLNLGISTLGLELIRGRETILNAQLHNALDTPYAFPGDAGFDIPGLGRTLQLTLRQEL